MSTDPQGASFSPKAEDSLRTPSLELLHTCDPKASPCPKPLQQEKPGFEDRPLALTQGEGAFYKLKAATAEKCRRHSTDGATATEGHVMGRSGRFHPYRRQYSDESVLSSLPDCLQPLDLYQGVGVPEVLSVTQPQRQHAEDHNSWFSPAGSILQASRALGVDGDFLDVPEKPPCYPSQNSSSYSSLSPLEQFTGSDYIPSGASQYNFQCVAPSLTQNSVLHSLYPKPIYSYSILIFMALKNSKTGSLPVSEIYSFMTENFPYFKTAPDGWKNSVRHNLSLNKCFEKVENKAGNASRKGCLWALNPAKVEKMQEELHKWRRKDPLTVRRSMARPEELDRLLGECPHKWKPIQAQSTLCSSHRRAAPPRGGPTCFAIPQPVLPGQPQHAHLGNLRQQALLNQAPWISTGQHLHPHRLAPDHAHDPYCSPSGLLSILDTPGSLGGLPQTQLPYGAALQATHSGTLSVQDLLLEGESTNDVDALNPSLTDLQLHGHLWEELKDDSLAPDSVVIIDASPSLASGRAMSEGSADSQVADPEVIDAPVEADNTTDNLHITGLYSTTFANLDSVVDYIPVAGNAPIPLL